jgi:hypothetical protein
MSDMFKTNGIGIHFFMFLTFLRGNGTKEQKEKWLDLAMEGKFMVCLFHLLLSIPDLF